jgi:hypothetical protein
VKFRDALLLKGQVKSGDDPLRERSVGVCQDLQVKSGDVFGNRPGWSEDAKPGLAVSADVCPDWAEPADEAVCKQAESGDAKPGLAEPVAVAVCKQAVTADAKPDWAEPVAVAVCKQVVTADAKPDWAESAGEPAEWTH